LLKLISGVSSQITQKKPFISLEGWTNAKSMVSELISNYPTPIIIQTGASQEFKSLPIEQYKIICSELLKENSNFCFILVGSKSEEKQAKKLEEINPHRILNLCGKTSIEEYSALISMGRLFIGSDSSGSHIAAFLDTPQVNLQVGPSSAYETAPYCNSALILSPSLDTQEDFKNTPEILKRQSALDPQVILLGIQYQLENYGDLDGFENYIVDHEFMHLTGSTRAWSTQIKVLDNGSSELYLNPLIKHYPTHQDFFRSLYYLIFKYRIEGQIETIPYIDISSNQTASKLENSIQGLEVLYRTADFGLKYSKMMERASVTNNREEILKFGTKLSEVDTLLKQLTVTYPEFQTFIHFYEVKRACSKGFNLVSLAREHKLTFQEMIEDIRIIFDLIQANVTELKNKYENKNKSLKKTKNIQAPAINIKEN